MTLLLTRRVREGVVKDASNVVERDEGLSEAVERHGRRVDGNVVGWVFVRMWVFAENEVADRRADDERWGTTKCSYLYPSSA